MERTEWKVKTRYAGQLVISSASMLRLLLQAPPEEVQRIDADSVRVGSNLYTRSKKSTTGTTASTPAG